MVLQGAFDGASPLYAFAKEKIIEEEGEEVGVADLLSEDGVEFGPMEYDVNCGSMAESFGDQGRDEALEGRERGTNGGREGGRF